MRYIALLFIGCFGSSSLSFAQTLVPAEEEATVILDTRPELLKAEEIKPKEDDSLTIVISPILTIKAPNIEHIPYLQTTINVKANGMATVEENFYIITTERTKDIPFYRTIPAKIETPLGSFPLKIDVQKVIHNGRYQQFEIINEEGIERLYTQDSKKGLPLGVNYFTIKYLLPKALNNYKNDRVFVWPVVDTNWKYAITRTAVVVKHTGKISLTGQNLLFNNASDERAKNHIDENNNYSFVKNDIIYPSQSLVLLETIAGGSVGKVSFTSSLLHFIDTNLTTLIYLFGLLFVLVYYIAVWFNAAKEKRKVLNPSSGNNAKKFMSAAALNFHLKKDIDAKIIVSTLLSLASKGFLKIEETAPDKFTFIRQITTKNRKLPETEKKFLSLLFPKGVASVELDEDLGNKLTKHRRSFEFSLNREYDKYFFKANRSYFVFGIGVVIASLTAGAFTSNNIIETGLVSLFMAGVVLGTVSLCFSLIKMLETPAYEGKKFKAITSFFLFLLAGAASVGSIYAMVVYTDIYAAFALAFMLIFIFSAYHLLKTDGKLGRVIKESSEAYKKYFEQTTKFMNLKDNPKKAMNLFAAHLPYSLVYDKEQEWNARFIDTIEDNARFVSAWYKGEIPFSEFFVKTLSEKLSQEFEDKISFLNVKSTRAH